MTEKFWQQHKKANEKNKNNVNPIIDQTYTDKRNLVPNKNFRELYYNCLQGALYLKQFAQSEEISFDDMGMLICRDAGCELQYCQTSIADAFEMYFHNCDEQLRNFSNCMTQEKRRYLYDGQGRSIPDQIAYMLEKKRREKYHHLNEYEREHNLNVKMEEQRKKEYTIKENSLKEMTLNPKL